MSSGTLNVRNVLADAPINNLPFEIWHPNQLAAEETKRLYGAGDLTTIPAATDTEISKGERGIKVWAVQRVLNETGQTEKLGEDGIFGDLTKSAVGQFQEKHGIVGPSSAAYGVFGPQTSGAAIDRVDNLVPTNLPDGLRAGVVLGESGKYVAAVNWSVPGGVDCSYLQRRVYSAEQSVVDVLERAWDAAYQLKLMTSQTEARRDHYLGEPGAPDKERATRLAVLYHNYPSGADTIASKRFEDLSPYWTTPQTWVQNIRAKFPDGVPITTPYEWSQHYSLGSQKHNDPGVMCRLVTSWN